MNHFTAAVLLVAAASSCWAQTEGHAAMVLDETLERERIRQSRQSEHERYAAEQVRCYARFAVNDCLADARRRRNEVLADLRRTEIVLNDAQRKRRAAEQLMRSDEKALRAGEKAVPPP